MVGTRVLGVFVGLLEVAHGQQQGPCDPKPLRLVNANDPAQYKLRQDRCEGVYDPQTAGGPALVLASYFSVFDTYDAATDAKLSVRWRVPASSNGSLVHLRAYSIETLPQGRQYQMDAVPSATAAQFEWPLQLIRDIKLKRPNLAVIAWISVKTNRGVQDVYIPLQISRSTPIADNVPKAPQIDVLPGRPLDEVYLTVELMNDDLQVTKALLSKRRVRDIAYPPGIPRPLSYPANIPKPIPLGPLGITAPGFYSLTLSGDEKNGPSVINKPLFFYYAQP
jgi:hypothetical protein